MAAKRCLPAPLTEQHIASIRASAPSFDSYGLRIPNRAELDAVRYLAHQSIGDRLYHARGQFESAFFQGAWSVMAGKDPKDAWRSFWVLQSAVEKTSKHRAEALAAFEAGLEAGRAVFKDAREPEASP